MSTLFEFQDSQVSRAVESTVVTGYLAGATVDLYQAEIAINQTTPLSEFTSNLANYTGYAQGAITWGPATVADDGTVEILGTVPEFRPTGTAVTNTIWGLFIRDAGGTALYFAGQFDGAPLPMGSTLDSILLTLRFRPATQSVVVVIS